MKIYIAGPMRGISLYNFPAFDKAAAELRQQGHDVVNPAELDRVTGFHEFKKELPEGFMRQAMKRDLSAICECDAIYLLDGWEKSSGVKVELALADLLEIQVLRERPISFNSKLRWQNQVTGIYYRQGLDGYAEYLRDDDKWVGSKWRNQALQSIRYMLV